MDSHTFWELIGKKITGEASSEELKQLDSLMEEHPEFKRSARKMEMLWHSDAELDGSSERGSRMWAEFKARLDIEPTDEHVTDNQAPSVRSRSLWPKYLIAASLLLLGSIWYFRGPGSKSPEYNRVIILTAQSDRSKKFRLPDGSMVWLNAKSTLTYQKDFGSSLREVVLTGEGYFDVVKDKDHPFIVNTGAMRLKVLGTAFNVRSFVNDKTAEAALIRGSIEVTLLNHPDKKIMLKPSEKLTVRNIRQAPAEEIKVSAGRKDQTNQVPLMVLSNIKLSKENNMPLETQWLENKLTFESETFEDLAPRMERYFNIDIKFDDENVKTIPFSGSFHDETIAQALKGLKATGNFNYRLQGREVTIYK